MSLEAMHISKFPRNQHFPLLEFSPAHFAADRVKSNQRSTLPNIFSITFDVLSIWTRNSGWIYVSLFENINEINEIRENHNLMKSYREFVNWQTFCSRWLLTYFQVELGMNTKWANFCSFVHKEWTNELLFVEYFNEGMNLFICPALFPSILSMKYWISIFSWNWTINIQEHNFYELVLYNVQDQQFWPLSSE